MQLGSAEGVEDADKVIWEGARELEQITGRGVNEANFFCMEALAWETWVRFFISVHGIAEEGVMEVGHMDADLMGTAGFEVTLEIGILAEAFEDEPMGDGGFSV